MRNLKKKYPHMDEFIYLRRRRFLTLATAIPGLFLAMADSENFLAFTISKVAAFILLAVAAVLYSTLPESEETEEDIR